MKLIKRFFIFLTILLILLVAAAIIVPIAFKDQISELVKTEANKQLNAEVDFEDVNISLFRSFPNLNVKVDGFSIDGVDKFEGLTLFKAKIVDLSVNLISAILPSKPIRVTAANIDQPEVKVMVLRDGDANYNIAKTSGEAEISSDSESSSNISLALDKYSINEALVEYEDHTNGLDLSIKNLNHSGSGAFANNIFDLVASTDVEAIDLTYGNNKYLKEVKLDWQTTLQVDQNQNKYTIKENKLAVNALALNVDGFVKMLDEAVELDLKVDAPENEFKNFFSLIPDAYVENFDQVDSKGSFLLEVLTKGIFKFDQTEYPAFNAKLGVKEGYVKYPDLPLAIENIALDATVDSPNSDFDNIVVEAPNIGWKLGSNPFKAAFALKTPISDPDVQSTVNGKIDLDDFKQAFPNYIGEDLAGVFDFDVAVGAKMSTIESGRYDQVDMQGNIEATNVVYPLDDYGYPALNINKALVDFTPQNVLLQRLEAKAGASDFQVKGKISNILAYFSPEQTMKGDFDITSKYFNVDEWYNPDESTEEAPTFQDTTTVTTAEKPFDRFDISALAGIVTIKYDSYVFNNTLAEARVKPNDIEIISAQTTIKDSDIRAAGTITDVFSYLYEDGVLGGDLTVKSKLINVNSIYNVPETPPADPGNEPQPGVEYDVPLIPKDMDMTITADVGKLKYSKTELNNIQGALLIKDQAVVLDDLDAKGLGGSLKLSGQYDTKDVKNPYFNIKYDLVKLDFVESFNQLNTFQRLNPVAEFIEGKYSSSLILEGKLGPNLYPVYSSLNAKGFLETADALLKGFKPLEQLGNTLKIDELKQALKIQDSRNFFEMKDGFVEVAPFDVKVGDIEMNIAGKHSIASVLDYKISAKVPRDQIEEGALGGLVSGGLSFLDKQAKQLGLSAGDAQYVNVGLNITGASSNPNVKIDVLGLIKGDGSTVGQTDTTSVKEKIDQKVEEGKEVVKKEADELIDSAKTVAKEKVEATKDTITKKAEETLKKEVEKKAGEILGKENKTEVDSIKKALDKFNPFKKKKKKKKENN